MKDFLVISLVLLLCGCSPSTVQKTATLVLPAKIARSQIDAQRLFAKINWDEDEPVAVDIVWDPAASTGREAIAFVGSWRLYDANDKEVVDEVDHDVGGGAVLPRGTIVITKGSGIQLPLDSHIGNLHQYSKLKNGRYYIIASFSGGLRRSAVRFTTENQWFEITDER